MTKIEARKVLERFEDEWLMERTSREVADAIRVAITALERCEVMDILDRPNAILCLCGGHMSEDRLPCWHCRGIEAHKIAYVTAVKDKSGRMLNTPVDTPYNYCPACGRKLVVEE